jgi:hypothetical protein
MAKKFKMLSDRRAFNKLAKELRKERRTAQVVNKPVEKIDNIGISENNKK